MAVQGLCSGCAMAVQWLCSGAALLPLLTRWPPWAVILLTVIWWLAALSGNYLWPLSNSIVKVKLGLFLTPNLPLNKI